MDPARKRTQACVLLSHPPMSDPFANLMNRYGVEAEVEKQKEEQIARGRILHAKIRKGVINLLVLAALSYAGYNYKPITQQLDAYTARWMSSPAKPTLNQNQQAAVNKVNDAAAKRDHAIDEAMR